MQSPVAVVIYTDTHTYKQKVLLYSKFMFNSKATANGNRYVREHLETMHSAVHYAVQSVVEMGAIQGRFF